MLIKISIYNAENNSSPHLFPAVMHHFFSIFQHILTPQLKEITRICVKFQSIFSIIPKLLEEINQCIIDHHKRNQKCLDAGKCEFRTTKYHTYKDSVYQEVEVCHKPCMLRAQLSASYHVKPLVDQTLAKIEMLCVIGCLEEILKFID